MYMKYRNKETEQKDDRSLRALRHPRVGAPPAVSNVWHLFAPGHGAEVAVLGERSYPPR